MQAYQKHTYLNEQEKQIESHQINLLLYKTFNGMKNFTMDQRVKKRKTRAA